MPCPLPRMPMKAHCACRLASSVPPRAEAEDSVSVIGYAAPTGFWMCVTQVRRFATGCTLEEGSHGELLTAADTTLITPLLDTTPVSGFEVRLRLTEMVRSPLWVSTHPQHSVSC